MLAEFIFYSFYLHAPRVADGSDDQREIGSDVIAVLPVHVKADQADYSPHGADDHESDKTSRAVEAALVRRVVVIVFARFAQHSGRPLPAYELAADIVVVLLRTISTVIVAFQGVEAFPTVCRVAAGAVSLHKALDCVVVDVFKRRKIR